MHFIVSANGSHGDVHPLIGVGRALAGRGHDVSVVSNERYADLAEGLEFVGAGRADELENAIARLDVTAIGRSTSELMRNLLVTPMRRLHEAITERVRPDSVVVAFPLVLGARLAHDLLGVPFVSCQLAPSAFRSVHDPPRISASFPPSWTPGFAIRGLSRLVDVVVDRAVKRPVNAYRAELGLPPTSRIFSWMDSPQRVLGLFPPWFGPPQVDWPDHVEATGFPLYDGAEAWPLSDELSAFLDSGEPPIVFTAGSPASGVGHFHAAAAQACEALGRRGILLTHYHSDVPDELPDGVMHADYAPFSALLPRAAAMVLHGGIGTCAQVLRAGVPALVTPWGMDQFDNSRRLMRLGVAHELPFEKVTPERMTAALTGLLADDAVRAACAEAPGRFEVDGMTATCEALERFAEGALAEGVSGAVEDPG